MGELQTEATVGAAAGVCAFTSDSCRKKEMTTTSGRELHTPLPVILPFFHSILYEGISQQCCTGSFFQTKKTTKTLLM
jgi:hypothetical protein